jgi:hypothetical protein
MTSRVLVIFSLGHLLSKVESYKGLSIEISIGRCVNGFR